MTDTCCEKYWLTDFVWLTLGIGFAFAFLLGTRALNVPDEGRYCEIAREMLFSHNFITPHINGIKYFEKPPLFYWMQTAGLKLFGLNEWGGRAMDALMALIGCLGTYTSTRYLYGRKAGLFSASILASSLLYFALARVVTLDMTVSIWISLSLFSFLLGVYQSQKYYYLLYIFAAFAMMTKGLIGIIFPGSIILIWLCATQNFHFLKQCKIISGGFIFLAIILPWHILVQLNNPEFFHFYFIDQQFTRYLTMEAHRYAPDWFYIPIFLLGLFPWTGFIVGAFKQAINKNNTDSKPDHYQKSLFLVISIGFILVFFSLSKSKLVPYILPIFPLTAALLGDYFSTVLKKPLNNHQKFLWLGFITLSVISLALAIALPLCLILHPEVSLNLSLTKHCAYVMSICLVFSAGLVPWLFWKKGFIQAFAAEIVLNTLFLFILCFSLNYIYMGSVKNMALALKPVLKKGDIIATYDYFYQDLPFYLNQTVTIVNWQGELEFGSHYAHDKNLMISKQRFWSEWQHLRPGQKIYFIVPQDLFQKMKLEFPAKKFIIFSKNKNDILISN